MKNLSTQEIPVSFSRVVAMEKQKTGEGKELTTMLIRTEEKARVYYSIAVHVYPCEDMESDTRIISDIVSGEQAAAEIFRKIVRGGVLPYNLDEVLSDML